MTEINYDADPELLENNEEGTGDESVYAVELPEYDHEQFELPDDYEDEGDEDE